MLKILVVEDDFNLACSIQEALYEYQVDLCFSYQEGYDCLEKVYDCYLIDLRLPDGSGMELCRIIRSLYMRPILIISSDTSQGSILRGYAMDVDDYIEKPFRLFVLKAKIRSLLKRYGLSGFQIEYGPFCLDKNRQILCWQQEQVQLSPAETIVVEQLMLNHRCVLRDELLNALYASSGEESSSNSLNVRISSIKKKLVHAPVQIRTVPKSGYEWINL